MDETDESNILVRVARLLKLEENLRAVRDRLGFDLAVQAEVIGPGVQKNKYGLKAVTLGVSQQSRAKALACQRYSVRRSAGSRFPKPTAA